MVNNTKRFDQLTKKWQGIEALGRKRLTLTVKEEAEECSTAVAGKGHCVMYTLDRRRFEVPLAYLGTTILGELLQVSREEFGFESDDCRITLPCDATVMEYVISLLRRNASAEVEKAFLSSLLMPCHHTSCVVPSLGVNQPVIVCSS